MTDWLPLLAGAAVAALIAPAGLRALPTRANYRGREVPFPAGATAVAASLLALGPLVLLEELAGVRALADIGPVRSDEPLDGLSGHALSGALLVIGVAFLGLLDDLLDAPGRGWRGHGAAILRGRFSTGALKALGTLALAAALVGGLQLSAGRLALAVAVVALTTNLFNLLDLRPGRAVKAWMLLAAGLLVVETDAIRMVGLWAGPLLVLGLYDLRERAMLGDTGSNVLGALAGLWLVVALDSAGQLAALAVLVALTAYGELRSFSAAIAAVAPLRRLDELGRPRASPQNAE